MLGLAGVAAGPRGARAETLLSVPEALELAFLIAETLRAHEAA